jgi:hypothetical protein
MKNARGALAAIHAERNEIYQMMRAGFAATRFGLKYY